MKYKLRFPALLLALLVMAGVGAISVQAAPTCQRLVKRYVEKIVPRHYSKATLARWQLWGAAHPNYHAPKRKPHLTTREVLDKVAYDCTVDAPAQPMTGSLLPMEHAIPLQVPPVELATIATLDLPVPPVLPLTDSPITTPLPPGDDVPEPASWMLALTGAAALLLLAAYRRRSLTPAPAGSLMATEA